MKATIDSWGGRGTLQVGGGANKNTPQPPPSRTTVPLGVKLTKGGRVSKNITKVMNKPSYSIC